MRFKFYADPGHGWLAVKRKLLVEYGVADLISTYSYQRGATVYLEEDCDAGRFLEAFKARHGEFSYDIETKCVDTRSPIRYYSHYSNH
jgi:hypothetical protein